MRFGAHISGGGSLVGTIEKAKRLEVDCLQLFATPPSNWNKSKYNDEQMAEFKRLAEENTIGPNFFHAIYLLNLGSDNPELLEKSIDSLTHYLTIAAKMGVVGTIFHTGSHKGAGFDAVIDQVCNSLNQILDATPKETQLIIEINAGQGNLIGRDPEELARMIAGVKDKDRMGVCIDTCHAFANGTDWRIEDQVNDYIEAMDKAVGWDKVKAIHVNDSKMDVGMNKDRHENLGEGMIGQKGLHNFLTHPKVQSLPVFLETPGFNNEGPDAENLALLRKFAT
jgi:deoxyribonuclease-4